MRAAEEAGFDAFFLPEFHQTRAGGVISPLLTGAALAEGTRRIRVGQAVVPGPLYHPVRLAEDVAMLSWLTRGRALLGSGSATCPPTSSSTTWNGQPGSAGSGTCSTSSTRPGAGNRSTSAASTGGGGAT